jgi:hypothetical protein
MARRLTGLLIALAALATSSAAADEWPKARISRLPDSAFAVVEISPGGRKLRHLPHHDETGAVDPAHLKAALGRLSQVKWLDRANEAVARRHLEGHALEAAHPVENPQR